MARNFCAILLAFGYAVLFVALSFVLVADNFYSYRDFGEFSYFSFVPFGFFAVCALAVYARSRTCAFLRRRRVPSSWGFWYFGRRALRIGASRPAVGRRADFRGRCARFLRRFWRARPRCFSRAGRLLCARGASAGRGRCSRFRRLCSRIFARRKSRRFRSRRARASRWRLPQPRSRAPREGFFQAGVSGPPLRRRAVRPS